MVQLFSLFIFLLVVAAAVLFGRLGYADYGWLGLVGGAFAGILGGAIAGTGVFYLVFFLACLPERLRHRRALRPHFGRYWALGRTREWRKLKKNLAVGDAASGTVVASFYHGVFIDTGHGFPARLAVIFSENGIDGPQPPIGATVSAWVFNFELFDRVIELTQKR
jgi:hypothetical protein